MKRNDDIFFGGRVGGMGRARNPDDYTPAEIDALMDAYFDGDIADDDRDLLFQALRRDLHLCREFVEMQRTTLLLERAQMGPDQTEAILDRIGPRRPARRSTPAIGRLAVAAAVLLAGAGLVVVGQYGPGPLPSPAGPQDLPREAAPIARAPGATTPGAISSGASNALDPGRLRATWTPGDVPAMGADRLPGLAGDGWSDPMLAAGAWTPGSLEVAPSATITGASAWELEGYSASPSDMARRMGYAFGAHSPWTVFRMLPPEPQQQRGDVRR